MQISCEGIVGVGVVGNWGGGEVNWEDGRVGKEPRFSVDVL